MQLYFKEVQKSIIDVKKDKRTECFNWGIDNAYPSLVEALIGMSVTSKTCSDRVSKAIYGGGFGESGSVKVNSKGQTLNEVLRIASRSYSKHNNCFLQVGYDANLDIKSVVAVPVPDCRIGKADDRGYSGKVLVYDNWDKSKSRKIENRDIQAYDRFNPDKAVVEKQIRMSASSDGKTPDKESKIEDIIHMYNGQILHIKKDDSYIYSMPEMSPVLPECLLESNSQTFRAKGAAKGFLGVKLLTTAPLADDTARDEFKKVVNTLQGADNSHSLIVLEVSQETDDPSKQINIQDLSSGYNDTLFEYSDKQAEKNICKAYTVPLILVSQTDNSLFGSSGEMLKEAKMQLWESREEERTQLEEGLSSIMELFQEGKRITEKLEIQNPYEEEEETRNINKEAQAKLRGTAAGVTGMLNIVKSVKSGEITKEAAVEIVKNIYGYTEKKAKGMIGGFEEETEN